MKKNNYCPYIFTIILIIILLIIAYLLLSYNKKENFANPEITNDNIKIYVITLRQEQRMINIKNQEKKNKRKNRNYGRGKGRYIEYQRAIRKWFVI
jgi:hypothetical protein